MDDRTAPNMTAGQLVGTLRRNIESVLGPLLSRSQRVALLDFPNHANVGDSSIWLGELAFLKAHSIVPAYLCQVETYSATRLRRAVGGGTIFIHGGGNFGDLWEKHQLFREQVVRDFPRNPIVQLPQTAHFTGHDTLSRARATLNTHPDFTLLVRDRRSLEFARNEFNVSTLLCPDMAFYLGPLQRPTASRHDIVVIARGDQERRFALNAGGDREIKCMDWLDEPVDSVLILDKCVKRLLARYPDRTGFLDELMRWRYWTVPSKRLWRGVALLCSGRTVVTDRLHAHILCLLLGIPHYLLDNSYGKNRNYFETWTKACSLVRWCDSEAEAMSTAKVRRKTLDETRQAPPL